MNIVNEQPIYKERGNIYWHQKKEDSEMNVNLAKQLLNRKGVYLTEEGKRRLEELIRDYK